MVCCTGISFAANVADEMICRPRSCRLADCCRDLGWGRNICSDFVAVYTCLTVVVTESQQTPRGLRQYRMQLVNARSCTGKWSACITIFGIDQSRQRWRVPSTRDRRSHNAELRSARRFANAVQADTSTQCLYNPVIRMFVIRMLTTNCLYQCAGAEKLARAQVPN